jgi:hypothetical protein
MCSWTHLHPSFIPNTPNISLKYGKFETVFGPLHGTNGLYLLKLLIISLLWIHTGHVMCSWTHLDPLT